jgi:aspartyl-tRNA synthetase
MRTDYCGELTADDIGREVSLCGWVASRREHHENLAFLDLRDRTGIVQCVAERVHDIRDEFVLRVTGTVRRRPDGTENPTLPTGEVEIVDCVVEVLSRSDPTPFPVTDRVEPDEVLRLRHRYVDLRRPRMHGNLLLRAVVNSALRRGMEAQGFVEVETPMLIASTPEGARDFVVPSRLQPGSFYALPQSPQLFKQLLMVGGFDRYYQIARCLRDEDPRADRQFEFMQLDIEASFVNEEEIRGFVSEAVLNAVEAVTGARPTIPSMTWAEAMERFGSDKPDVRFGMELVDLTPLFVDTDAQIFRQPSVKGICVSGGASFSRSRIDALVEQAKRAGAAGLAWVKVSAAGALEGGVAKLLSEHEQSGAVTALSAGAGDLLLFVAGERAIANRVLGMLRIELGRPPVNEGGLHFLWVVDFPLFEGVDDDGRPIPAHHPFTMPHPDDLDLIDTEPLKVRSQAYDLVLNGWELGSGSVRIHRRDVQQRIFSLLGIDATRAQERFGFLLDAFRFGAPPHAGFAVGIDRLVAVLAGEENIREVIAFPKTQSGSDPLTSAPTPIEDRHLAELGLRVLPPPS